MPTITHPKDFSANRAWGALDIATFDNTSVRLHWTDQPYIWHVNDGQEVFVVVDGVVDMFYREAGAEHCVRLHTGDIFHAEIGCEHVAHPVGVARILVVETVGSVWGTDFAYAGVSLLLNTAEPNLPLQAQNPALCLALILPNRHTRTREHCPLICTIWQRP